MTEEKCNCFYASQVKISMIMDCSYKHLTSKVHLERKHLMLGGKWGSIEDTRNTLFAID